jgi:hypothetical protein
MSRPVPADERELSVPVTAIGRAVDETTGWKPILHCRQKSKLLDLLVFHCNNYNILYNYCQLFTLPCKGL